MRAVAPGGGGFVLVLLGGAGGAGARQLQYLSKVRSSVITQIHTHTENVHNAAFDKL